ncbi:MAG: VacJ family lipoprotein [Gammaproteobacteria bacterium]|mgnify:FL=1|jgi:phospholipid-binding lipoprotein MlaA|nr:VacJ family lipoprotein [Gammaproteobacteria bacterium]MBT7603155.1 VacJ family lipoprotein [Gammaproteobacteria bacterium]
MRHLKVFVIGLAAILASGCASVTGSSYMSDPNDPWQTVNRPVFAINDAFDQGLFKPLAEGYNAITPEPIRNGVTNFFSNLNELDNVINNFFQGKITESATSLGRFVVNSTIGIGGLLDVASNIGLEKSREDLGQTLGVLGTGSGPYVVLPLLGSSSVRDIPGRVLSMYLNPLAWLDDISFRNIMVGINAVDDRSNLLAKEDIAKEISNDKYTLYKDAYLEEREFQVLDGNLDDSDLTKDIAD